jgi:hypothetical protein
MENGLFGILVFRGSQIRETGSLPLLLCMGLAVAKNASISNQFAHFLITLSNSSKA